MRTVTLFTIKVCTVCLLPEHFNESVSVRAGGVTTTRAETPAEQRQCGKMRNSCKGTRHIELRERLTAQHSFTQADIDDV